MSKRRAGKWARQRARGRRREILREHWRPILVLALVVAAVSVASVVIATRFGNANVAWFVAGAIYGTLLTFWLTVFELLDPISRYWINGAEGEELTASELRRCRNDGWRSVHNIHLHAGDIDHVAVGPGGVLAIETKSSDAEWRWLASTATPAAWARQAKYSALRTKALIRQHSGVDVDAIPVVVVWARGLRDAGPIGLHGVRFIHGRHLASELRTQPHVLDALHVERIASALEPVAHRLDERSARSGASIAQ
jgi:hypothetical protein